MSPAIYHALAWAHSLLYPTLTVGGRIGELLQQIATAQHRLRAFLDHMPGITWTTDANGRFVDVGAGFEGAFGLPPREVIGRTFADIWPMSVATHLMHNTERVLATGETLLLAEQLPTPDGDLHEWYLNKFLIDEPSGRYVGCAAFDVTQACIDTRDHRRGAEWPSPCTRGLHA